MPVRHSPYPVDSLEEVRRFFDQLAQHPDKRHGPDRRLLNYQLQLIHEAAAFTSRDTVLDVGCGVGDHLMEVSEDIQKGIGVDLSEAMIDNAREQLERKDLPCPLTFRVDQAETLGTIPAASIDVVLCIGALEHMLDKQTVFETFLRVLRPGGRLVCLTPNGAFLWYTWIAPAFGWESRHLSTDHFLKPEPLQQMLWKAGFTSVDIDYWRFVPAGDMPGWLSGLLRRVDVLGRHALPRWLRGGLLVTAKNDLEGS